MSYSITAILHSRPDKNGLHKIQIRVIHQRKKTYHKTDYKVKETQFDNGSVINHYSAAKINKDLRDEIDKLESRLLKSGFSDVKSVVKKTESELPTVAKYIASVADLNAGRLAPGTIKHVESVSHKLPDTLQFADISIKWLQNFESGLRKGEKKLDGNTVHANMKRLKGLLKLARKDGFLSREQYEDYKVPAYTQKLVEYLSEEEITAFQNLVINLGESGMKRAGYYFLLSCYTGYRLGDNMRFDFDKMVSKDKIVLRTDKNKRVVSMPIHSRLKLVLQYVKENPIDLSEFHIRQYVKKIAGLAGIKKKINFHTSRHSFAMLLMANGFTRDEVAELIGDSEIIAKVYARIHNESLSKKIKEKLG